MISEKGRDYRGASSAGGHRLWFALMVKMCVRMRKMVSRNLVEISCPVKFLSIFGTKQVIVSSCYNNANKPVMKLDDDIH